MIYLYNTNTMFYEYCKYIFHTTHIVTSKCQYLNKRSWLPFFLDLIWKSSYKTDLKNTTFKNIIGLSNLIQIKN